MGDTGPGAPENWIESFGRGSDQVLLTLHVISPEAMTTYSDRLRILVVFLPTRFHHRQAEDDDDHEDEEVILAFYHYRRRPRPRFHHQRTEHEDEDDWKLPGRISANVQAETSGF